MKLLLITTLAICFIAFKANASGLFTKAETTEVGLQDALENPYFAPEISGIKTWINSNPLKIESLKGKVVLVDFWTYSCINCIRTLPYVTKWDQTYRDKGLVIIGIHAPEFEFEKNSENVQSAIEKYHIKYPVALDNNLETWHNFQNRFWPAHYLIDQNGKIVYSHFGEGNYAETENNIRHLLGLNKKSPNADPKTFSAKQTPETYLGYYRAENFSNSKTSEKIQNFKMPNVLEQNHWALDGKWQVEEQRITSEAANSKLKLNFTAKKVFLVLGSRNGKAVTAKLKLNGRDLSNNAGKDVKESKITFSNHMLYELVNQDKAKNGLLEITASEAGLEAYAFTFGN